VILSTEEGLKGFVDFSRVESIRPLNDQVGKKIEYEIRLGYQSGRNETMTFETQEQRDEALGELIVALKKEL